MNVYIFFGSLGGEGLRIRIIRSDLGTDHFHYSIVERLGILGIKYELKELRMNVMDMLWSGRPWDNERRW